MFYLGEIALDSGNKADAMKMFGRAMEQDGAMAGPRYRLGQYALEKGELQKARTYLASEIKLAAEDSEVLVSMASMFLVIASKVPSTQRNDSTLSTTLKTGSLTSGGPGQADDGEDKNESIDYAVSCLLHAIDVDPGDANAHYYLGLANAMTGRLEDAAEFFTQVLDMNPQHVLAIRDLATVYLASRHIEEAANVIDRGVRLVGDHSELKNIRSKIRRAQIARQLADLFGKSRN
jgi:tetratricopeptide (TPR) repeat protein